MGVRLDCPSSKEVGHSVYSYFLPFDLERPQCSIVSGQLKLPTGGHEDFDHFGPHGHFLCPLAARSIGKQSLENPGKSAIRSTMNGAVSSNIAAPGPHRFDGRHLQWLAAVTVGAGRGNHCVFGCGGLQQGRSAHRAFICRHTLPMPPKTRAYRCIAALKPCLNSCRRLVLDPGKMDRRRCAPSSSSAERGGAREPYNQPCHTDQPDGRKLHGSSPWWVLAGAFSTDQNEPENARNQDQTVPTGGQHYCPYTGTSHGREWAVSTGL